MITGTGSLLLIHRPNDDTAIVAALRLAMAKWPNAPIFVRGDRRFKKLVMQAAIELKVEIEGAEGRVLTPTAPTQRGNSERALPAAGALPAIDDIRSKVEPIPLIETHLIFAAKERG